MHSEKEIVLTYVDAFNRGDLEAVCAQFTDDARVWGVLGWGTIDQARPIWQQLIQSLQINLLVDSIISEGSTVAARYTETGKSVATFMGIAPTGRMYEITAMEFFEIKDGRIHRRWGARDSAAQSRQLGFPT